MDEKQNNPELPAAAKKKMTLGEVTLQGPSTLNIGDLERLIAEKKAQSLDDKKTERKERVKSAMNNLGNIGIEGALVAPKTVKKKVGKKFGSAFSGAEGALKGKTSGVIKENNRFYLPVLNLNKPDMWESQPMENRVHFTDKMAYSTCVGNCCGTPGLKAGCCYLDTDDIEHVLGPVDEPWIKSFVKWLRKKGIAASRHDVVIDFEEGKLIGNKFFSESKNKDVFQREDSYPILRIQAVGPRFACKFLNFETGKCTIYEQRSAMCKNYLCNYVKSNFLIREPNHPNTYVKSPNR